MFDDREYRKAMEEVIARFQSEMKKVRTGRAHPDMLANIKPSRQCHRLGRHPASGYPV